MTRLSRYLFVECGLAAVMALLVLTFLIMLPRVLGLVDLWVNKGVAVGVLLQMIILVTPQFIVATAPMALLVGILMALGRLSQDSEIIILSASGVSLYQILWPIATLVGFFSIGAILLNAIWVPSSSHQFASLKESLLSTTTLDIKPQTFNHAIPGLTIYIHAQGANSLELRGILIHDQRDPKEPTTLTALSGRLHIKADGNTALLLSEGSRHHKMSGGRYRQLNFSSYNLDLGVSLGLKTRDHATDIRGMSMGQLRQVIQAGEAALVQDAYMEWHRRLAFPVAGFILGLLAVPLSLQQSHRSGRGYGFIIAVIALIVHFMLLSVGEALAKRGDLPVWVGYGLPNILMALFTVYVMVQTARGRQFRMTIWLTQGLSALPLLLLRARPSRRRA